MRRGSNAPGKEKTAPEQFPPASDAALVLAAAVVAVFVLAPPLGSSSQRRQPLGYQPSLEHAPLSPPPKYQHLHLFVRLSPFFPLLLLAAAAAAVGFLI